MLNYKLFNLFCTKFVYILYFIKIFMVDIYKLKNAVPQSFKQILQITICIQYL